MENLSIYNKLRAVPQEAQRQFNNGRFSGTDINAMWRIKMLTETFGMVGFGWRTQIVEKWTELGANEEMKAFVRINLYVKVGGEWSAPIEGIGGSHFVSKTSKGMQNNDECYKMAYTDAIGVACKALGMGADVYWSADHSKYQSASEMQVQDNETIIAKAVADIMAARDRQELIAVMTRYKDNDTVKHDKRVIAAKNQMNVKTKAA